MSGLLLRLAAPMQSWGEHSTFAHRDTCAYPTRSGLIGLIAGAQGRPRGASLDDLAALEFTIRVDRPGIVTRDFHTIGGGYPANRTVPTAEGKRRTADKATIISHRYYLADAVFTIAVQCHPQQPQVDALLKAVAAALHHPVWAPYLGRRSCPAEMPLLLAQVLDPVAELRHAVPLARKLTHPHRRPDGNRESADSGSTVEVEFVYETPPDDAAAARLTLNDIPVDLHPHRRRYRQRDAYVVTEHLPERLCAGYGVKYLAALHAYRDGVLRP